MVFDIQDKWDFVTPMQDYTTNTNIQTYSSQSNELKVTYTSPNYLKFYINGALVNTFQTTLAGGVTGFIAEVQTFANGESFPTYPVIDAFAQALPTTFSGNMVSGPSGARASIQAMPPVKSGSIAPQPNRFPTPR